MIDKLLMTAIENKKKYYMGLVLFILPVVLLTVGHTFLLAFIIDGAFLKKRLLMDLMPWLVLLFAVFMTKPVANGLLELYARKNASRAKQALRSRLSKILAEEGNHLENENTTGYFATLACDGIESTDAFYAEFVPQFLIMTINTVILLLFAFTQDWISGLIMAVTAPLIPVFMILIGKTAEGVNLKQWQTLSRMNGHLLDLLRGLTTLKYFQKDAQQAESVAVTSENFRTKTMSVLKLTFLSAFALELTATLSTAVIAVSLGVRLLYGQIGFLPALTVLLLAPEYYLPLRQLGLKYHAAMNAKAVSQKLKPLFELEKANEGRFSNGSMINEDLKSNTYTPEKLNHSTQSLHMDQLSFGYDPQTLIFDRFTAEIPLLGATAITGTSGIGKTTLIRLICGDYLPLAGKIRMGELDLSDMTQEEVHQFVSVVPQQPRIFIGSLYENLSFGNPGISHEAVMSACELTGFAKVVKKLPEGLETPVGEGIQALSGGETQLLAITRAYLRNTPIILLDEPSSALDPISEELVTKALSTLAQHKCLVIAAHRAASIALCQRRIHLGGEVNA